MRKYQEHLIVLWLTATISGTLLVSTNTYAGDYQVAVNAFNEGRYEKAFSIFQSLAEQGHVRAQNNLSLMYLNGRGVPENQTEAVKWLTLAAQQGYSHSQYNLAQRYSKGEGVEQNIEEAVRWLQLSARQGLAEAQINLGVLYYEGKGVTQDYIYAHMWFDAAFQNGHFTGLDNKKLVEEQMTTSQIELARTLAIQCLRNNFIDC